MKAPISLRSDPNKRLFQVNSDPAVLDEYYMRMLGSGGEAMLSEEVKWQAITHKSFDQGRRGYNDRLAFLGKWIVQLQTSLSLVQDRPAHVMDTPAGEDSHGREPFRHASLEGLEGLTHTARSNVINKKHLAQLGQKYGLQKVLRWEPKNPNNLAASGFELVLAHTMYAIIGAIAMERGGVVANQVARERILNPLGLGNTGS
ncbi:hypothetical protein FQN54_005356 [Arachnomyces sp. PD_36]|nr:hypothetical protein FQN54_005356 [Arachnomyces sp. PD_36]